VRMRGRPCPKAWACRLLAKLPVPERVGSKVLPILDKSLFPRNGREEALGEQQEPPRIHAGEVSEIGPAPGVFAAEIQAALTMHQIVELIGFLT
jgi:hypothetical protein